VGIGQVVFTDTIASGASTSGGIDFGGGWSNIVVQVGSMSTAAAISVQHSSDGGTTYYNLFHPSIASATVGTPQYFIASGVGTNGGVVPIFGGLDRVRFLASAVVSGGVAIKVICSN
jgi:hypothetical protein